MNKYAKMSVTYQFGDSTETLNGDQIHGWLIANADGSVSVDSSKVSEYVFWDGESTQYFKQSENIENIVWFHDSGKRRNVWLEDQPGWQRRKRWQRLLPPARSTTREPEYSQKAASHGANDYGDTYVEINLTGQHLFFYKEGKLVVESDFVSGNLAKGWGTPAGSYPLAYKQKNAVLKGENYRTPVNYWMPFNNGIGMHDAKLEKQFWRYDLQDGRFHG
ncbi:MAG: L,D-transpeptidase [Clostridium fessum]